MSVLLSGVYDGSQVWGINGTVTRLLAIPIEVDGISQVRKTSEMGARTSFGILRI